MQSLRTFDCRHQAVTTLLGQRWRGATTSGVGQKEYAADGSRAKSLVGHGEKGQETRRDLHGPPSMSRGLACSIKDIIAAVSLPFTPSPWHTINMLGYVATKWLQKIIETSFALCLLRTTRKYYHLTPHGTSTMRNTRSGSDSSQKASGDIYLPSMCAICQVLITTSHWNLTRHGVRSCFGTATSGSGVENRLKIPRTQTTTA
ncbi:hypothetical protein BDW22DRAFT_1416178 [Trametopsis cervina]|nr:hypothetical protein BDW22DRAFT_1416178 [Trametopsis cervina]